MINHGRLPPFLGSINFPSKTTVSSYPPTPAAQGGARKGKGFSDTALVAIFSVLYPPTPTSSSTTTTTITTTQQAAAGSSRQQQAAAGISRQQQTQADAAAVSATAAVQQLAARKIVFF